VHHKLTILTEVISAIN